MHTATKKTTTIAATAALLTGTGLAVSLPAQATAPAAEPSVAVAAPSVALPRAKGASSPVIVYRSGTVSAKASISAAPKVAPAKKKGKKKYKSRRS